MIALEPQTVGLLMLSLFALGLVLRLPLALALVFSTLPFVLSDRRFDLELLVQRMYAGIDSFVLIAVPLFILAATILTLSGMTDRLISFASATFGGLRGGLGVVNVASSVGFSGMSGSSTADVAGAGSMLIPQMVKRGYTLEYAAAVTAASAVMSTIIPPSIQMIVWGSLTNTSIGALFLGALFPGLAVGISLGLMAYIVAIRAGFPAGDKFRLGVFASTFLRAAPAFGIIVIVLVGFRLGLVTATEASVAAVIYALLVAVFVYRSLSWKNFVKSLEITVRLTGVALLALAAASVIGYLLAIYQVPFVVQSLLEVVPAWAVLLTISLVLIGFGLFVDGLPAMAILIPVFAPFVAAAGLDPVHYGVVAVMSLAVGLITPPVGICLLVAAKIGDLSVTKLIKPILPFILAIIFIIGLVIAFPNIVLWLPGLS